MKEYLSKDEIEENQSYFIAMLKDSIHREGARVDDLIKKLEMSDFFIAPATTQYYGSYAGGLCEHSIEVFTNLINLVENKLTKRELDGGDEIVESLVIIGLLHDICKMNRYEQTVRNVKRYCQDGKNRDDCGNYNWESSVVYQTRQSSNRFIFGSDGETSEYMIRQYIPLNLEESIAIINAKGDTDGNQTRGSNLGAIFSKYNLPVLLHCADMLACYVDDPTTNNDRKQQKDE